MKHWLYEHSFALGLLVLFVVSFVLFLFLTDSNTFADPDSFYHIKIAEDIAEGKDVTEFPWLPFTTLSRYYTDQHFLYHVFLVPFVHFFEPFAGSKLASILLACTLVTFVPFFLKRLSIRYPLLYGFLLLTVVPTIFRINLVKAPAFSILILLIGLFFALKRNRIGIFVVSFVYVWSYGGFILLPLFVLLLTAMRLFAQWWKESEWLKSKHVFVHIKWSAFFSKFFSRKDVHVACLAVLGTALGVIINPFFPDNLLYLNDQLIQIGIVNYQSVIQVGGEWYPYNFLHLVSSTIVLAILVLIAFVWGAVNVRSLTLRTFFFFLLYVFFLLFTLKSRRYVEYYGPFGMLFVASAFSDLLRTINLKNIILNIRQHTRHVILASGIAVYVIVALSVVLPRDFLSIRKDFSGGFQYTAARNASQWLQEHTPEGSIVVHSSWDEFPYLLYWNDHNRYIGGLDPTFSYRENPDRYWSWVNLTLGKSEIDIEHVMLTDLQSGYAIAINEHDAMKRQFEAHKNFRKVYEDDESTIYAYKDAPIL